MRIIVFSPDAAIPLILGIEWIEAGHPVDVTPKPEVFLQHLAEDPSAVGVFYQEGWINGVELAHEIRVLGYTNLVFGLIDVKGHDADYQATAIARVLNAGADDAQLWPIRSEEMLARLEALHRRQRTRPAHVVLPGGVLFDPNNGTCTKDGFAVALTQNEGAMLSLFASRPDACITKGVMMSAIYPDEAQRDAVDTKILDVFICKLRKKLAEIGAPAFIETVWAQGWRLKSAPSRAVA